MSDCTERKAEPLGADDVDRAAEPVAPTRVGGSVLFGIQRLIISKLSGLLSHDLAVTAGLVTVLRLFALCAISRGKISGRKRTQRKNNTKNPPGQLPPSRRTISSGTAGNELQTGTGGVFRRGQERLALRSPGGSAATTHCTSAASVRGPEPSPAAANDDCNLWLHMQQKVAQHPRSPGKPR